MRPRLTIVLWGVFLALCIAYWWTIRGEQEAMRIQDEARLVFAGRGAGELQRIAITRLGEQPVVAERTGAGWQITAPHALEASPQVWNRIADAVAVMRNERSLEVDTLDHYGLDTPRLRASFEWGDGAVYAIEYGIMEPTARYRYARDGDGQVFLVANDAFVELDRPLAELRNRYLVGTGRERIERIAYTRVRTPNEGEAPSADMPAELEGGVVQATVVFEMDEAGLWQQIAPVPGLANQDRVDDFISHVQFAVGRDFNDNPAPLPNYGMQPGVARIEAWFDTGATDSPAGTPESQVLFIGGPADERGDSLFAKREGQDSVFTVDATTLGYFPTTPNAFLEHRLLTYGTRDLKRITYRHDGEEIILEDTGDEGWFMVAPALDALDSVTFSSFVSFLTALEGSGFPQGEPGEFGLDEPAIEIRLEYANGGAAAQPIRVGSADPTGESYYARTDRGTVVSLPASQVAALRKDAFYFKDKQLIRVFPVVARTVSLVFEGQRYEFSNVDGLWVVGFPEGLRWESQADMRQILDALAKVRAVAVVQPDEPDEAEAERLGLAFPILAAEVTMVVQGETHTVGPLEVGAVAPAPSQSRYARVPDRPGVYHVDQGLVDDIREALRGIVRSE